MTKEMQQKVMLGAGALGLSLIFLWALSWNEYYILPLLGVMLTIAFFIRFDVVFPGLLVARSCLDIFTDVGFYLGPMNLNVPSAISLFVDIIGGAYLLIMLRRENRIFSDPISRGFLFWTLILLFWAFWAYHCLDVEGLVGLRDWTRLFSLFIIYLLSKRLVHLRGYEYVVHTTLLSLAIPLVVAYYQIIFQRGEMIGEVHRVYGTLAHPNPFSLYLVLFMGVICWKIKFAKRRLSWILLQFVLAIALLNAFSLGGIVMASVLFFVITFKELSTRSRVAVLLVLACFLIGFAFTESGSKRIAELKATPTLSDVLRREVVTNSFTWRLVNWKVLMELWARSPLLGYGLNTSVLINPVYNSAPHNDYLRFLVELGILGFVITMLFLLKIWLTLTNQERKCTDAKKTFLLFVVRVVFVSWAVGATVDNYIVTTTFQFYFWALLASVMTEADHPLSKNPLCSPIGKELKCGS